MGGQKNRNTHLQFENWGSEAKADSGYRTFERPRFPGRIYVTANPVFRL